MPFVVCMARSPILALWKVPQTGFFLPFSMGMLTTTRYGPDHGRLPTYLFTFFEIKDRSVAETGSLMYAISTYFYRFLDDSEDAVRGSCTLCYSKTVVSNFLLAEASDNAGNIHFEIPEFMKGLRKYVLTLHLPPSIWPAIGLPCSLPFRLCRQSLASEVDDLSTYEARGEESSREQTEGVRMHKKST